VCQSFRTGHFTLTSESEVPFQLDGELAGRLPATFGLQPATLRLCVP
jgi:diacylglycerol kinase family enzyme